MTARDHDPQLLALKVPPHSEEAEQSLLGALLLDNTAFDRIADLVVADDLYRDDHRRIFRHIARLIEQGKPADMVTVAVSIAGSEDKDRAGGTVYLGSLAQSTPSALNIRRYAELVRERSIQRSIAQIGTEIAEEALGSVGDVGALLDMAESRILAVGEKGQRGMQTSNTLQKLLARNFERIDHLFHQENKTGITGVPTGYVDLDDKTAGMQPSDLIIIAGRPSMGKTALALNIAEHVAVENGLAVAIFSMEMSGEQLSNRMLGSIARVDQHKMRTGQLHDDDWTRLSAAMEKLHAAPIEIDETGALNIAELRARARRMRRRLGKLGLVIVDYLQLMEPVKRSDNRATDVAEMSRGLKALAKELQCPVIALSQLNRGLESRTDKRPYMSDLRESGAIEQDADVIILLYREEFYYPDDPEVKGICEVNIAKQRNGPTGIVNLAFLGHYTRFENLAHGTGFSSYAPRSRRGGRGAGTSAKGSFFDGDDQKKAAAGTDK